MWLAVTPRARSWRARKSCGADVNAHTFPVIPAADGRQETAYPRFPRLTAAQKLLQQVEDAAFWRGEIARMNLKPGIIGSGSTPSHPAGGIWGTARSQRNVL